MDGGSVEIAARMVYELDGDGKQLRVREYTDYTAENVRTLYTTPEALREEWLDAAQREEIINRLKSRGVTLDALAEATGQEEADPLDLLCHVAYKTPLSTRRERANRVRKEHRAFFECYSEAAREVLSDLLDKYAEHGAEELTLPDALKVPPLSDRGRPAEIVRLFGGFDRLKEAVHQLQTLLYR